MPLLWNKSRVGRISKMVADLRSPKRRGESMVVQTGFPTSLIDLFVKNRDRLRKQKNNTKKNRTSKQRSDVVDSVDQVSDKIVSCSEDGCGGLSVSVIPSSGEIEVDHDVPEDTDSCVSGGTDVGRSCEEVVEVEELGRGGCGGDVSLVYVALAKVFAVVALTLCTTQFAVGITLAAFLLLFLEFIGKYFGCLKKPYLNVKSGLQYMVERIGYGILVLRSDVVVKEKSDGVVFELVEPGVESDFSVEEIEIVEVQSSGNEGVSRSGSMCVDEGSSPRGTDGVEESVSPSGSVCIDESVSPKGLMEYLIMDAEKSENTEGGDHRDDLSASVCEKSKSRKMGGKFIKKFVSQKLRIKSKKYQSGTDNSETKPRNKVCVSMVQEGSVKQESQREGFSADEESENSPLLSVTSVNKSEIREADGIVTSWIVEKKGTEIKDNFGYLKLFLIALVGLVGGRVLALMLIITWCFMLKVISSWRGSGYMPFSMKKRSPQISL